MIYLLLNRISLPVIFQDFLIVSSVTRLGYFAKVLVTDCLAKVVQIFFSPNIWLNVKNVLFEIKSDASTLWIILGHIWSH